MCIMYNVSCVVYDTWLHDASFFISIFASLTTTAIFSYHFRFKNLDNPRWFLEDPPMRIHFDPCPGWSQSFSELPCWKIPRARWEALPLGVVQVCFLQRHFRRSSYEKSKRNATLKCPRCATCWEPQKAFFCLSCCWRSPSTIVHSECWIRIGLDFCFLFFLCKYNKFAVIITFTYYIYASIYRLLNYL